MSKTYKNISDNGYTTYYKDGSRSVSYKNITDNGYTTYHDDGSRSVTYKNTFDNGYTTFHYNSPSSPDYNATSNSKFGMVIVWGSYIVFCGFFAYCIFKTIGSEMWKYLLLMFAPSVVLLFLRDVVNGSVLCAYASKSSSSCTRRCFALEICRVIWISRDFRIFYVDYC